MLVEGDVNGEYGGGVTLSLRGREIAWSEGTMCRRSLKDSSLLVC